MALGGLGGAGYLTATHVEAAPIRGPPTAGGSAHTTPGAGNKLNRHRETLKDDKNKWTSLIITK